jgi:BolA protein
MKQARIEAALQVFSPLYLRVENESHLHSVPAGAESHFKITLVSLHFEGKPLLQRHKAVYAALADMQKEVHALALHTLTPAEWQAKGGAVPDSPLCHGGSKSA